MKPLEAIYDGWRFCQLFIVSLLRAFAETNYHELTKCLTSLLTRRIDFTLSHLVLRMLPVRRRVRQLAPSSRPIFPVAGCRVQPAMRASRRPDSFACPARS